MELQEWTTLQRLFDRAVELPEEERSAYVTEQCGEDPRLREKLEAMLLADRSDDVLETNPGSARHLIECADTSWDESEIGPYSIERRLGTGGMGVVYLARFTDVERAGPVALKLLKRGLDTDELLARFFRERRALASLEHPNIACLVDGGSHTDGRPYFVMEYIEGQPIDAYCREHSLTIRERIGLFVQVCSAVEYAHRHLIVHRDLKPSNVLVTAAGAPKLLDFGIVKLLGEGDSSSALTQNLRPMTLEYASPEQIRGEPITTASDTFSLGALLYELVTGRRPFVDPSRTALEEAICELDPLRPGALSTQRGVTPDLDNVILKALRKEPRRRYASVAKLAEDLERVLAGFPVQATPPTRRYRMAKFIARNRALVAAAVAVTTTIALGVAGMAMKTHEATIERNRAVAAKSRETRAREDTERVKRFLSDMLTSVHPDRAGEEVTVREVLDWASARVGEDFVASPEAEADLRHTISDSYLAIGELESAREQLEQGVAARRRALGEHHFLVADDLNSLGVVHRARGDLEEAERNLRQALEIFGLEEGGYRVEIDNVRANLASVMTSLGKYGEAEAMHRSVLASRRELSGEQSLDVAETLNNLANCLRIQGDTDEALEHLSASLAIRRELLPPGHTLLDQSIGNLGVMYMMIGRVREALPLIEETAEHARDKLGSDHPDLAPMLSNLASALRRAGESERAEEPAREALALRRDHLEPGSFLIAATEILLGKVLVDLGKFEEAEPLLVGNHELYMDAVGSEHEQTRELRTAIVTALEGLGFAERAAQYR